MITQGNKFALKDMMRIYSFNSRDRQGQTLCERDVMKKIPFFSLIRRRIVILKK